MRASLPTILLTALLIPAACGDSEALTRVKTGRQPMLDHFRRVLAEGPPTSDADQPCPPMAAPGGAKLRVHVAHADLLRRLIAPSDKPLEGLARSLASRFSELALSEVDRYPDPLESDYATKKWADAIEVAQAKAPLVVAWTSGALPGAVSDELVDGKRSFSSGHAKLELSVHDPETGRRLCSTSVTGENADAVLSHFTGGSNLQGAVDGDLAKQAFAAAPEALARIAPTLEIDPSLVDRN